MEIESNPPEADVAIIQANGGRKVIGKTPIDKSFGEFSDEAGADTVLISLSKSGFEPQNFILPYFFHGDLNIKATLPTVSEAAASGGSNKRGPTTETLNLSHRTLMQAYKALVTKDYPRANNLADALAKLFPELAAPLVIKAIAALSQNNKAQASNFLNQALSLDSEDPEIKRLLRYAR